MIELWTDDKQTAGNVVGSKKNQLIQVKRAENMLSSSLKRNIIVASCPQYLCAASAKTTFIQLALLSIMRDTKYVRYFHIGKKEEIS